MRAHAPSVGGVNIWGYRGAVVQNSQTDRLALLAARGPLGGADGRAASVLRQIIMFTTDRRDAKWSSSISAVSARLPAIGDGSHYGYLHPRYVCLRRSASAAPSSPAHSSASGRARRSFRWCFVKDDPAVRQPRAATPASSPNPSGTSAIRGLGADADGRRRRAGGGRSSRRAGPTDLSGRRRASPRSTPIR